MTRSRTHDLLIVLRILVGIAAGALATPKIRFEWYLSGSIDKGDWTTHPQIGTGSGHPCLNAVVAVGGLYALRKSESVWCHDVICKHEGAVGRTATLVRGEDSRNGR